MEGPKPVPDHDGDAAETSKPEQAPEAEPIAIEEPIEPGDPDGQPT